MAMNMDTQRSIKICPISHVFLQVTHPSSSQQTNSIDVKDIKRYINIYISVSAKREYLTRGHNQPLPIRMSWSFTSQQNYRTNSTDMRPFREIASCAATHEIPTTTRNTKFHDRAIRPFYWSAILSQISPVHITPFPLSEICLNIILHFDLPSGPFPSRFPTNNLYALFISSLDQHTPSTLSSFSSLF
jgi:hypothetical protein